MSGERGSALVIAVLLMAILTLLGVSYLFMANTENRIAENERLSAQAFYFGEGVAREVKRWFDRPPYSTAGESNLSRPTAAVIDRSKRLIDVDGPGPTPAVDADGSAAHPYYKTGVDRDADGNDDLFDKPYRPELKDMFVGVDETRPDVQIDRGFNSEAAAFLDALSEKIMPGFPAGPSSVGLLTPPPRSAPGQDVSPPRCRPTTFRSTAARSTDRRSPWSRCSSPGAARPCRGPGPDPDRGLRGHG